jgi:hypothetical protein
MLIVDRNRPQKKNKDNEQFGPYGRGITGKIAYQCPQWVWVQFRAWYWYQSNLVGFHQPVIVTFMLDYFLHNATGVDE